MMSKPTLCLDFDGVIHRYSRGWKDGSIYDDVVAGFFDWAQKAYPLFRLVVYSSRSKTLAGIEEMRAWLEARYLEWATTLTEKPGLIVLDFTFSHEKPPAFLTIDDRGLQFRGDWNAWWLEPKTLRNFQPWTVKPPEPCPAAKVAEPWDGRPPAYESDGWHWLRLRTGSRQLIPYFWDADPCDDDCGSWETDDGYSIEAITHDYDYHAPCVPPVERST